MSDIEGDPYRKPIDQFHIEEDDDLSEESHNLPWLPWGVRYYLASMFVGSIMTALSKYLMKQIDPDFVMFSRMVGTLIPSIVWLYYKGSSDMLFGSQDVRGALFLRGTVGTVSVACTYYAIQHMSLPNFATLNFLTPLLTALTAHIVLGESYYWQQAVASSLAMIGVAVIARPSFIFDTILTGDDVPDPKFGKAVFIDMIQILASVVVLILLRVIGQKAHALASVCSYAFQVVIFSGVRLAWTARTLQISIPSSYLEWVLVAVTGVAGFLYQFGMSKAFSMEEASSLTQFDYVTIIYSTAWELILFGDLPDLLSLLGMFLILIAVFWSAKIKRDKTIERSDFR